MPTSARRSAIIALVALATAAVAWLTWPRPDLHITIALGGTARVARLGGSEPLRDTVYLKAAGPVQIRIENADTTPHRLGIFAVAPHSTSEYTISQPGVYSGYCSTHPGRRLTYVVR